MLVFGIGLGRSTSISRLCAHPIDVQVQPVLVMTVVPQGLGSEWRAAFLASWMGGPLMLQPPVKHCTACPWACVHPSRKTCS